MDRIGVAGFLGFRYNTPEGQWREKLTGVSDRNEARKIRTRFLAELEKGVLPGERAEWKLKDAEKWWIEHRTPRLAPGTLNSERYRLQWIAKTIGNKRLCEITNTDLDSYQNARLSQEISAHSVNKECILWGMILRRAPLASPRGRFQAPAHEAEQH